ncbi:MAG: hypothetical protein AVDCRST_MAG28-2315 [uncultured Rubrobacteraceae bacterium]|uniref:Uncharacterized protein n=1 Tax=uncultured Rubrobacteraceae bacterium TaxID=349277 RepID=A0A6J4QU33_9ACTN|nr:MAG: hypothetical protein AVDCRST_MAG28-2315 [uncultured Rubrobacteraceae bacterium]
MDGRTRDDDNGSRVLYIASWLGTVESYDEKAEIPRPQ